MLLDLLKRIYVEYVVIFDGIYEFFFGGFGGFFKCFTPLGKSLLSIEKID
jgi:hypothetical protein